MPFLPLDAIQSAPNTVGELLDTRDDELQVHVRGASLVEFLELALGVVELLTHALASQLEIVELERSCLIRIEESFQCTLLRVDGAKDVSAVVVVGLRLGTTPPFVHHSGRITQQGAHRLPNVIIELVDANGTIAAHRTTWPSRIRAAASVV